MVKVNRAIFVLLAIMLSLSHRAWGSPAENAATLYRQAFAALPDSSANRAIIDNWEQQMIDPKAAGVVDRCQPAFRLMHSASEAKTCDWQLDYGKGFGLLLPELSQARRLACAASLAVRVLVAQKKDNEAIDLIHDELMLSQDLCREPKVLVFWLVGEAIRDLAVETSGAVLPNLSKQGLQKLKTIVDAMPDIPDVVPVLQGDQQQMVVGIRLLWANGNPPPDPSLSKVPQDPAQREKLIDELRGLDAEVVRIAKLSPAKAEAALPAFQKRLATASTGAQALINSHPERLPCILAKIREKFALLSAAISVAQSGPDVLKTIRDPLTGDEFIYTKIDGGFELSSTLTLDRGRHPLIKVGPAALN